MNGRALKGAFKKPLDALASTYVASIPFDWRLYAYDITGSIAHTRMLSKQQIITDTDAKSIIAGLETIRRQIDAGQLRPRMDLEDVHMNIEAFLYEQVGPVAGKLHTARSRNDQIALDVRLYLRDAIIATMRDIKALRKALVDIAAHNLKVIVPGYTHLQRAQPVLISHHFMAYFEMFTRDSARFADCMARVNVMPLGSGALAGVPYPIDREYVARELGFTSLTLNSMDAVSDRDFVIDYQAAAATAMMHVSRLCEELVLWSSTEFGIIDIDEGYSTGSSIMPQKRNPDIAELARGKTGRVYGNLLAILTTMKGLPLAYDRDMQEDKEGLFDTVDTLSDTLKVMTGMVGTLKVNAARVRRMTEDDYQLATDVADYLVAKGISFREAHEITGRLTRYAIEQGKHFSQLKLSEYRAFSNAFRRDVKDITAESSVSTRDIPGGTAPSRVAQAIKEAKKRLRTD